MDALYLGFSVALSLDNLIYCLVGILLGTFIGVLPGVGPLVTIALLLPLTFNVEPVSAIIMLSGIYYGSAYGGSTTSILVNIPGESSSVMTCLDGHQMARKGDAGKALAIAAIGSFFAGCVGTVLLSVGAPLLTSIALTFGEVEYFSLMLFALVLVAAINKGSLMASIGTCLVGVLVGLVGIDVNSAVSRFTFGASNLAEGISFVAMAMGMFAFAEVAKNLESEDKLDIITAKIKGLMPTWADLKQSFGAIVRGTGIGSVLGALPGAGLAVASFVAYIIEKRISRTPERFGKGAIEGVAAPESANNAAAMTAFIPTLSLGIPGSATMALVLGALMIQGIMPGPGVINNQPELFWGLVASMWIGNLLLLIVNLPLVGLWVRLVMVPYRWLFPTILMLCCLGNFSVGYNSGDIYLSVAFAVLGYIFIKLDISPAPFILGMILGPMAEEHFRRALLLSRGDFSVFVTSPISASFIAMTVIITILLLRPTVRDAKDTALSEGGE